MKIVHTIIGNCYSMTQRISESQERELKVAEKIQMALHTSMCPACNNFKSNTIFLRKTMRGFKNYKE